MDTKPILDRELSARIAESINAEMGTCWENSLKAMPHLPDNAVYIEGWVVAHDYLPLEHGWCEVDGKIIDTKLHNYDKIEYFGGVRYTRFDLLIESYQKEEGDTYPFIHKKLENGWVVNKKYRAAAEAAYKSIGKELPNLLEPRGKNDSST